MDEEIVVSSLGGFFFLKVGESGKSALMKQGYSWFMANLNFPVFFCYC